MLNLLLVAGARPNFMKVAPLIKCIQAHMSSGRHQTIRLSCQLIHTGQHYDDNMSDVFFRELGIPRPEVNLQVGSGSHAEQTAQIMMKFEPVLLQARPDWVVVVGDVNSTMACTLVAAKLGVKVAHVEAGLRSFDRTMPEEINRILTDCLADLLLTPSYDANENLEKEGIRQSKCRMVGNIMIDCLVANLDTARRNPILERLAVTSGNYAYVTLHRPANVDEGGSLTAIAAELKALARQMPVVLPLHPRTRKKLCEFGIPMAATNGMRVLEPIGYHESIRLTENARFVLTDSGGLQEETTYFRTPCLTLRPNTERPITVTLGSNRLTDVGRLASDIHAVLASEPHIGTIPPLWDGRTADRILDALLSQ